MSSNGVSAAGESLDAVASKASAADDLLEFLKRGQLDQYHELFIQEGITLVSHLRDVEHDDYSRIGLKPVEIKRLDRFYSKWKKENKQSLSVRFKAKVLRRPSSTDISVRHSSNNRPRTSDAHVLVPSPTNDSPVCLIQLQQLAILKQLGKGSFGVVNEARWTKPDGQAVLVAVKTLDAQTNSDQVQPQIQARFIKEANILHQVSAHPHIIKLLGIVIDPQRLMIVQELAKYGSLLSQLRERPMPLSVVQLCLFARQIASAMAFLEKKSLVHRDLAARNVLLLDHQRVKLSDFGLSRVISQQSSMVSQPTALPIAWTAPEAVTENVFSHKSDVWSFGITLWEMLSGGARPYATKSMYEIIKCVQPPENYRLERPHHCPLTVYKVMLNCWEEEPSKRPSFQRLEELLRVNTPPQASVIRKHDPVRENKEISLQVGDTVTILDTSGGEQWLGQNSRCEIGYFAHDCVQVIEPPEPDVFGPPAVINRSSQSSGSLYPNLSSDSDDNYVNMSAARSDEGYALLRKLDFVPPSASSTSSSSRLSAGHSSPASSGSPGAATSAMSGSSSADQLDRHSATSSHYALAGKVSVQAAGHFSAASSSSHSQRQPELILEHQDPRPLSSSTSGSHTSQVSADELLHGEPPNPKLLPPPLVGTQPFVATSSTSPPSERHTVSTANNMPGSKVAPSRKAPKAPPYASPKTTHSGENFPALSQAAKPTNGALGGTSSTLPPSTASVLPSTASALPNTATAKLNHETETCSDENSSNTTVGSLPAGGDGKASGSALAPLEEGSAQVARLKLLVPAKSDEECRRALIASQWSVDAAFRYICVNDLMSLSLPSITPHQCLRALDHCNWKADRAAEWLLQLSFND